MLYSRNQHNIVNQLYFKIKKNKLKKKVNKEGKDLLGIEQPDSIPSQEKPQSCGLALALPFSNWRKGKKLINREAR